VQLVELYPNLRGDDKNCDDIFSIVANYFNRNNERRSKNSDIEDITGPVSTAHQDFLGLEYISDSESRSNRHYIYLKVCVILIGVILGLSYLYFEFYRKKTCWERVLVLSYSFLDVCGFKFHRKKTFLKRIGSWIW